MQARVSLSDTDIVQQEISSVLEEDRFETGDANGAREPRIPGKLIVSGWIALLQPPFPSIPAPVPTNNTPIEKELLRRNTEREREKERDAPEGYAAPSGVSARRLHAIQINNAVRAGEGPLLGQQEAVHGR